MSENSHLEAEYRIAGERIGQYDGYVTAYTRWYVAVFTAAVLVAYHTEAQLCHIYVAAGLAFLALHISASAVRSVTGRIIEYCEKVAGGTTDERFAVFMHRDWKETWKDLGGQFLDGLRRAGPAAPLWLCVFLTALLTWQAVEASPARKAKTDESREISTRVYQVDGVTSGEVFRIQYDGGPTSVQIAGIRAADAKPQDGAKARSALRHLILGKDVCLHFSTPKRNSAERLVARVFQGDTDIGDALVEMGHAERLDE